MNNLFSVITTSYNDEHNVGKYLDSIVNQTLPPSEIIIVDGGSKDKTCQKIREHTCKTSIPIYLIEDGRLNIAEAFNIGIRSSHYEYVLITCMGNSFSSTMCDDLYNSILEKGADSSFGLLLGVDKGYFSSLYNRAFIRPAGNPIMSNRAVMYKKSVFEKIGFFIEKFKYAGEDSEFLNRFKEYSLVSALVNKPIVFWETPNSWEEYVKQCKNYAIAELQHASISNCLLTSHMIRWYIVLLFILLSPFSLYFTLGGFFLSFVILFRTTFFKRSFKVAVLYESWAVCKIYFSIRYIKYIFPGNRVNKLIF